MSTYLPKSKTANLEVTNEISLRGLSVYDTLMGLSSNLTGLATNINGTDMTLSGNTYITGFIQCNRVSVTSLVPTVASHLTSKQYVDSLIPLSGTGLTKTGVTFSVNSAQSGITSVGTLTGLNLSGALSGTSATFSSPITVGTPTVAGNATRKDYVDSISYITAGTGLTKTGSTLSVNAAQPGITSLGTLTGLNLSGALSGTSATFSSPISIGTPTVAAHATRKDYVDSISYVTAGTGLTKTGSTLSVDALQTQITSLGTLTGLSLSGALSATSANFSGNVVSPAPTVGSHLCNKTYVDGLITTASGNLTKTDNNITLNPSISLETINVTDTTESASNGVGSVVLAGGLYSAKKIRAAGNITAIGGFISANGISVNSGGINVTGVSSFANSVSVYALNVTAGGINVSSGAINVSNNAVYAQTVVIQSEPTEATHATTKAYVDNLVSSTTSSVNFNSGFVISGTTFSTPVDTSFYTKIGRTVQINVIYAVTGSTGTSNKIIIYLPIIPASIQYARLTMSASLEAAGFGKIHIASIFPAVGASGAAYIQVQDTATNTITDGTFGGNNGATRTYHIQFSYFVN